MPRFFNTSPLEAALKTKLGDQENRRLIDKHAPHLFAGCPPTRTRRLTGGLTNQAFFVQLNTGKQVVARLAGNATDNFINRNHEKQNTMIAAAIGIGVTIETDDGRGNQLVTYLDHPTPMTKDHLKQIEHIKQIATLLKKLHTSSKSFANNVNVFQRNKDFLHQLQKRGFDLSADYETIAEQMNLLEQFIQSQPIRLVPCHNDTTPSNFILSNKAMKLIDWEYSGNNDPVFDLANLAVEAEFTAKQDQQLLTAYYGDYQSMMKRYQAYKPVIAFWVALWAQMQISNQNYSDTESCNALNTLAQKNIQQCHNLFASDTIKKLMPAITSSHRPSH